ncbi:MAG: hypothetical protein QOK43_1127 [Acidimicrobiaceae bacterium]|nr:hypothetical protein [Acidimicrobiaceae bacterium]
MQGRLWWYTARSAGLLGWALLAASVLWGLALSSRAFGKRPRPNWLLDLHRFLGGLAVVFTAVHVVAIVLDDFVHFGLADVLVPLASSWHPVAVAWGVVAVYLLVAVEVTSLLRSRISKRVWRATHYASFPLFALATVHGLSAGTDGRNAIVRVAMLAAVLAVTGLSWLRAVQAAQAASQPAPVGSGVAGRAGSRVGSRVGRAAPPR